MDIHMHMSCCSMTDGEIRQKSFSILNKAKLQEENEKL